MEEWRRLWNGLDTLFIVTLLGWMTWVDLLGIVGFACCVSHMSWCITVLHGFNIPYTHYSSQILTDLHQLYSSTCWYALLLLKKTVTMSFFFATLANLTWLCYHFLQWHYSKSWQPLPSCQNDGIVKFILKVLSITPIASHINMSMLLQITKQNPAVKTQCGWQNDCSRAINKALLCTRVVLEGLCWGATREWLEQMHSHVGYSISVYCLFKILILTHSSGLLFGRRL